MGRPPKPSEDARSERVVTYVTKSELRRLERLADRKSLSLSAVVHQLLSRSLTAD